MRSQNLLRVGLLVMIVALAGCFRQAGDSLNPPEEISLDEPTAPPITVESGADADAASADDAENDLPVTSTIPDVDITVVVDPTQPGFGEPVELPTIEGRTDPNTPEPTIDPFPTAIELEGQAIQADTVQATATSGFITPGGPSLPITVAPSGTPFQDNPTATPSGLITPTSPVTLTDCNYTVQSGDNLYRIALNNNASLADMRAANPELVGENPILDVGQVLTLPNCGETAVAEPAAVQNADAAQDTGVVADPNNPLVPPPPAGANSAPVNTDGGIITEGAASGGRTHTVAAGETLYSIAIQYSTTINAIVEANDLPNPDALDIGDELVIP